MLAASWLSAKQAVAERISIVSMILGEGLQQDDGGGFYGDIIREILRRTNHAADFEVYPFKRTLNSFFTGEGHCIWGLDITFLRQFRADVSGYVESAQVLKSTQYLFHAPNTSRVEHLAELRGKTIGVLNGTNIEAVLTDNGANVIQLPDQESKIRMLLANRLDAIGGWVPDLYVTMKAMGTDPQSIRPGLKLGDAGVAIVCHRSTETVAFLQNVDKVTMEFRDSQDFVEILKRYGVPPSLEW